MTEENVNNQDPAAVETNGGLAGGVSDPVADPVSDPVADPEPPAYQPNYNYKVLQEEREFPEWARGVIKSEDDERNYRDLFEKAEGLEHVKARRELVERENKEIKEHWTPIIEKATGLNKAMQERDLDTVFENLGLTENDIFGYAKQRLDLRENPQQLQAHNEMRQIQARNRELELQNQQTQAQANEMAVQQRSWELGQALSNPVNAPMVQAFDARQSQPGAFRDEVIRRGQYYASQGRDVPVNDLVAEMTKIVGWNPQQAPAPSSVPPNQSPVTQTLPNMRGSGSSPAKMVPKSTEDLRKLARKMRAQG